MTNAEARFNKSHIRKVYACLAVTCHLHFWQNDRDFLRATVVTRGWNGYRNKSQHRKSTLEKKILPPFQQGFEPATFQSRVRRSNHWAIAWERERENLCLMSSDVLRHIRDKLYETLNTNLREKLVGCKTVYFGLVHLYWGDPCQDLGGKLNLEIWCPSGLKICILFSSKVKIYIKMRIKTFLGPV